MDDLVEFYRARLDEDLQRAEAAGEGSVAWLTYLDDEGHMKYTTVASGGAEAGTVDAIWVADGKELPEPARVLVVYDQARALREVEAKRRLLDEFAHYKPGDDGYAEFHTAVRLAALPHADHPDYREDWAPDPR